MLPVYMISGRDRRHIVLFTAPTLEAAAEAIAAQRDPDALVVFASDGGVSRELTTDEHERLAQLMG
jgi:hypothetical protein